jgi:hypothetical protein
MQIAECKMSNDRGPSVSDGTRLVFWVGDSVKVIYPRKRTS